MPYFSFSLKKRIYKKNFSNLNDNLYDLEINKKYFSKNTYLYKLLKNNYFKNSINYVQLEKREKLHHIGQSILICLPPSIGLGDAIEYALSIKALVVSNKFKKVGVAYVGRFKSLFEKYFNLTNIYCDIVSEKKLASYISIFHITLEIEKLINQKYERQDIEDVIIKYFNVPKFRKEIKNKNNQIKKISIFPISQSPLRSLNPDLINGLMKKYQKNYSIEIILDHSSKISNHIEKKLLPSCVKIYPKNLEILLKVIQNVDFGIFVDSGPLHFAKIINVKGVLITTTVSGKKLLNDFDSINEISNNYKSLFCHAPCGLTNLFNYNNLIGCYQSLKISKNKVINLKNLNSLQRGNLKNNYIYFIDNPVGCQKNINLEKVYKFINIKLNEYHARNS